VTTTDFDQYARSYDRALGEALNVSGEDREYFARGRVGWLADCLGSLGANPCHLMDYGCGTGSTSPLLLEMLAAKTVVGVDTSLSSLAVAQENHNSSNLRFVPISEYSPAGSVDLIYCNGVVHHIPPAQRKESLSFIYDSLKLGGLFSLWENNPWNPGARYVMARCAFDRDAITLTPNEAKAMLQSAGFEILCTDFLFVFPRLLRVLRPTEKWLARLPLGAQYHILCRRLS
jgi:SAM-dependent methyltransferase